MYVRLGTMGKFVATLRGHVGPVYRLAWSADSRMVVSASKDSTVKVRPRLEPNILCDNIVFRLTCLFLSLRSGILEHINSKMTFRGIRTKCIVSISLPTRSLVEDGIGR